MAFDTSLATRRDVSIFLYVYSLQRGAVKAASAFTGVSTEMSDAERAALAEKVGFRSVAKELPDGVNLMDIIKTLPPEVCAWDSERSAMATWAPCWGRGPLSSSC